ncbi:DUF1707 SHOCT-like domain-containing protein [Jiangella gansuensis]|uniref:DUF1707 SHOCT-like domain-containing protein n=1 Tax=Jiangella gansuensis TaxID=281473 RepID=UPI0004B15B75|nr:DUF1707 domain-containing protein [Jiangella gansuensis]
MVDSNSDERRALQRVSDADRESVAERVRAAASDGRLGLDELDERLGAALAARTHGELSAVVADLGDDDTSAPVAKRDPEVISAQGSNVERVGRWVVPERLTVPVSMSSVVLDFMEATFTGRECHVTVDLSAASLNIVVPDDIAVEVNAEPSMSSVNLRRHDHPVSPRVVVRVDGELSASSMNVSGPGWWRRRKLRKAAKRAR